MTDKQKRILASLEQYAKERGKDIFYMTELADLYKEVERDLKKA